MALSRTIAGQAPPPVAPTLTVCVLPVPGGP